MGTGVCEEQILIVDQARRCLTHGGAHVPIDRQLVEQLRDDFVRATTPASERLA
jgi:hypothetical protein